ncbi:DUF4179 domain-containing protein [Planococcus lenghuensis]|uniref:DUF4179 domain-containing protein n=1 Tax=Planococcus lenghuensis TaxID=2213202 RepID=A0A1Q2KWS7_9BACL|nr:DUF4179 domain-containing protein [Planococcus lenghuensis]AQQ52603.1 hypothetical protein B0X71_05495 [Planococcus lenghuensis]
MAEREEAKLNELRKRIEATELPLNKADGAILQGMARAKREQEQKRRKRKRGLLMFAAAAVLFLALVTSIRVSPAFASSVASIPGMERFVEMIRYDKGLRSIVENDYVQNIGVSQTKEKVTLTIDGVILDESGINVHYTLTSPKSLEHVTIRRPSIENGGQELPPASIGYGFPHNGESPTVYTDVIEYRFSELVQYDSLDFTLGLEVGLGKEKIGFLVPFEVPEPPNPPIRFDVNQSASIEGQAFTVETVTIHPLQVAVDIKFDSDNSMKILNIEDMRLVDETGEIWSSIANGLTSTGEQGADVTYYLQSNYFETPEELVLKIGKLQAVDQENAAVVVDTESEVLLRSPSDGQLKLDEVSNGLIRFYMEDQADDGHTYDMFGQVTDATGKQINLSAIGMYQDGNREYWEVMLDEDYTGPLAIELTAYPTVIEGDVEIPLKKPQ